MQVSKSTDKRIRALVLELASDLEGYVETLTEKAMCPTIDTQDLIDEMKCAMNELEGDTFMTYEKWLNNAVKDNEI